MHMLEPGTVAQVEACHRIKRLAAFIQAAQVACGGTTQQLLGRAVGIARLCAVDAGWPLAQPVFLGQAAGLDQWLTQLWRHRLGHAFGILRLLQPLAETRNRR